jgi:1-aminocyclopropane-1-carboxylate deaminase
MKNDLIEKIKCVPQASYPVHSRIHRLKSYDGKQTTFFVKREDELGFGISGSKIRKYRTLIPYLLSEGYEAVVVIGSLNSNHVLSFCQLLIENQIKPLLFLRGDPARDLHGNGLLLSQLIPFKTIRWFSKEEWKNAEQLAEEYAKSSTSKTFVLHEGGSVIQAFPGALTLPLDILRNEEEEHFSFDHIFIDSGTGLMAISLILAFSWLKKQTQIHVVLIAGEEEEFLGKLQFFHTQFEELIGGKTSFPHHFTLYKPEQDFGKIKQTLFDDIKTLARTEGFLTDPIYTIKLFNVAKKTEKNLKGNVLINHSGGTLSLMGFQDRMRKTLQ